MLEKKRDHQVTLFLQLYFVSLYIAKKGLSPFYFNFILFRFIAEEDLSSFCSNRFYVSLFYDNNIYFPFVPSASNMYAKYWPHAQLRWIRSQLSHALSLSGYSKQYMDFIDHFWCSDLIWTTWTWYGFCARTTTKKFGKPFLNHSIRLSRVRIIFIELGLGF